MSSPTLPNGRGLALRCLPSLALLAALGVAPAARAQLTGGPTAIVSRSSGKCANVEFGSTADVARVIQYVCNADLNSSWTLEPLNDGFRVIAAHSGKCLNVEGASTASGARVIQYTCQGAANEQWALESYNGWYRLRAKHSGKCLNVYNNQTSNSTGLIQWDCVGGDNELWQFDAGFVPVDRPVHLVSTAGSRFCTDVYGGSTAPGAQMIQWPCKTAPGDTNQSFTLERSGAGYRMVARHSGLCVGPLGGVADAGAKVVQGACTGTADQQWRLQHNGASVQLVNLKSGLCLEPVNGSLAQAAALLQNPCSSAATQEFQVSVESHVGAWGPVTQLPLVPVAAATLNNGKVMAWAAYDAYAFGGDHGQTETALIDPVSGAVSTNLVNTGHDMFCPGTAMLPDGNIVVNGGSSAQKTSTYDPAKDLWSAAPQMNIARGYNADTVLATGDVFTIGGSWSGGQGGKTGEVFKEGSGWTLKPGLPEGPMTGPDPAGVYRGDNHAWLFGVGDGRVFHAGPSANMNWFDTAGGGTSTPAGARADDAWSINGNATLFDVGRILKVGGAPAYKTVAAVASAYVIDIRSGVTTSKTASLAIPRSFHTSVVLPDGRVLVVGGQSWAEPFTDATAALPAEIWSPQTGSFTTLASMRVPRTYHSIALLLQDGRVLVGGGGLCGDTCDNNHPDYQIYSPDYLFQPNGQPAVRPQIVAAPASVGYAATIAVSTAGPVASFALVRQSSVTHTTNNDQRRVPLAVVGQQGNTYTLSTPASSGVATPGYYLLFAIDNLGVPSVAQIVQVK